MNAKYPTIIEELRTVMYSIDDNAARELAELIDASPRIFLSGAGRSGLMVRAFAMRVMHAGKEVHVLGDVTTPSAKEGDLLIIASGSGTVGHNGGDLCFLDSRYKITFKQFISMSRPCLLLNYAWLIFCLLLNNSWFLFCILTSWFVRICGG